jgi:glycosyltransferase involved in cell wall biosynthesis
MLEALRADPCRFVEALLDYRGLYRFWRAWRRRGTEAILAELSTEENLQPPRGLTDSVSTGTTLGGATLLVIDATLPQYDRDAGGRSSFLYLQTLREMGHQVFFMPNDQMRREPYASALEGLGVKLLMGPGLRCGQWKRWLRDRAGQITHVVLHRPNVAMRYLAALKKMTGMKILYFAHDLRFRREERHYELNGDAFHRREAEYWERIEKNIISQVDAAYFFSDEETKAVSVWTGRAIARTVPLFPVTLAPASGLPHAQRAGLLFVGGFAHQPNRDAVSWFAREVFPLVRQALPDIEWHIVGREPPAEIRALAGNGIFVEGVVSEARLETLYQTTRLAVAPLRFGAGVKGKVVEAVFQGIPLVTTAIGAEGMPDPGAVLDIHDIPRDFADALIRLYRDEDAWSTRRDAIKAYVAAHFSKDAARRVLEIDISAGVAVVPAEP